MSSKKKRHINYGRGKRNPLYVWDSMKVQEPCEILIYELYAYSLSLETYFLILCSRWIWCVMWLGSTLMLQFRVGILMSQSNFRQI